MLRVLPKLSHLSRVKLGIGIGRDFLLPLVAIRH
jgi:hypothetical protein